MTADEIADRLIAEWDKTFPGGGSDGPEFYDGMSCGIRFAVEVLHGSLQASSD